MSSFRHCIGKRFTFTATIEAAPDSRYVLLVRVMAGDALFRDHLWLRKAGKFKAFKPGERITFSGKVNRYFLDKGSRTQLEITNIRDIERVTMDNADMRILARDDGSVCVYRPQGNNHLIIVDSLDVKKLKAENAALRDALAASWRFKLQGRYEIGDDGFIWTTDQDKYPGITFTSHTLPPDDEIEKHILLSFLNLGTKPHYDQLFEAMVKAVKSVLHKTDFAQTDAKTEISRDW